MEPKPVISIADRIEELKQLKDGWHDGEGVAPSKEGLDWLASAFAAHYPEDLPVPLLFPMIDGKVQVVWPGIGGEMEVDLFRCDGTFYAFDNARGAWMCLSLTAGWMGLIRHVREGLGRRDAGQGQGDLGTVLAERGARYGSFVHHAVVTQSLKRIVQHAPSWDAMDDDMREAVEMILHKVGRIACGDPSYLDSWVDIQGYARLVQDRLAKGAVDD